jgi:hypothetical protein
VAGGPEDQGQRVARVGVVVRDENPRHDARRASGQRWAI